MPVVFAGGTGVIAALSNMVPDLCAYWIQALREENFDDIARMHKQICALMSVYSMTTPFMSGMKHLIGLQGTGLSDAVRLPALSVSKQEAHEAQRLYTSIEGECHVTKHTG